MSRNFLNLKFILSLIIILLVGSYVISYARKITAEIREFDNSINSHAEIGFVIKPDRIVAKGVYLTAFSAANQRKREEIIDLIKATELNAVVIDIKDYTGYVLYDSSLDLVNKLDTETNILKNVRAIVNDFKEADIYVIARQTVFQDPILAKSKPEWAIQAADGGIWHDYKGLAWVDPTRREIWEYNSAIAKEASTFGFDEINFDYVRFPSDGNISTTVYAEEEHSKTDIMHAFFMFLNNELRYRPVRTSLDLFGLVLEAHNFDLNIGQQLTGAIDTVDYIYPMTYPSHYPNGHLGYINPADFPYEVVSNGLTKAHIVMATSTTRLRPWLQAFDLGAVYDGEKIRAQITAVEESELTDGWMLWNASNRYSDKGLRSS